MWKFILIGGLILVSLAMLMGLFVVLLEHLQHRKQQHHYDDLHRRMGLGAGLPPDEDDTDSDT